LRTLVEEIVEESQKPELAEEFGLPRPITGTISKAAIDARVAAIYSAIYDKLNHKLALDAAASDKAKQLGDQRAKTTISSTPDSLLTKLVERTVDTRLSEAGYGQPDATMNGEHVSAADFIKSLPLQTAVPSGKGKSPLAEVGHNQSSRTAGDQKGLGKKQHRQRQSLGKGKGKDKGKGKGKASMPIGRRGGKGGKSKGKPVA
jgi:hypothetical protein